MEAILELENDNVVWWWCGPCMKAVVPPIKYTKWTEEAEA